MIEWGHTAIEIFGVATSVTLPVILYLAANKRDAKKERLAQHEENKKKLDAIISEREFFPPHGHIEEDGPLQAEGVIKRPNGRH
jgi:hypothetical protein